MPGWHVLAVCIGSDLRAVVDFFLKHGLDVEGGNHNRDGVPREAAGGPPLTYYYGVVSDRTAHPHTRQRAEDVHCTADRRCVLLYKYR